MIVFAIAFVFMILLGAFTLSFQIFKMVELDATNRGLKHPKFWGFFSMSGNNGSSGLILYLLGRKKYLSTMNENDQNQLDIRKKRAIVSLGFIVVGTIGMFITMYFYLN